MEIPAGYKEDAKGNLVPVSKIKEIDLMRDNLVFEIVQEAIELNELIKSFKHNVFGNVAAFVQLSGEQYGAKLGGNKGNVTLTSYDGRYKLQRAYAETLVFLMSACKPPKRLLITALAHGLKTPTTTFACW